MRAAVLIGVLLLFPAFAAPPKHVRHPAQNPDVATLNYPAQAATLVKAKDGATYKLHLDAVPTVHGTIADLVLVVQRADAADDSPNLLDPPGNWHGYQAYTFAATDFKDGADKSLFGMKRVVCRLGAAITVEIAVTQSAVELVPQTTEWRFKAMEIEVVVRQVSAPDGVAACG